MVFQFEPNYGNVKNETSRQLEILSNLGSDRSIVDKTLAANMHNKELQESRYVYCLYREKHPFVIMSPLIMVLRETSICCHVPHSGVWRERAICPHVSPHTGMKRNHVFPPPPGVWREMSICHHVSPHMGM